ncbi:LexA family transcriptional regulator [Clostridium sediminicola]|uniref:transcriptional repressor LexA n=1 Tax=Clostridium sediminicola TaxID=3114879 RepID=UPI0031F22213
MHNFEKINNNQKKFIINKPVDTKIDIVKGKKNSGKTTALSYRILFLKNNYLMNSSEEILVILYDEYDKKDFGKIYKSILAKNDKLFESLLTNINGESEKIKLKNFADILDHYYLKYKNITEVEWVVMNEKKEIKSIVEDSLHKTQEKFPRIRILKKENWEFFYDEIKWIKSCKYNDLNEYLDAPRLGRRKQKKGPKTIKKGSSARKAIIELFQIYNENLKEHNFIDYEDKLFYANEALEYLKKENLKREYLSPYIHIIIDNSEKFSKSEIDFIKNLYNEKSYSTFTFSANIDNSLNESKFSNFVRNGRVYSKSIGDDVKKFSLNKTYFIENNEIEDCSTLERYKYFDLKHVREYNILRDSSGFGELILEDTEEIEYKPEELIDIPIFSNIAAGEPIMISPEQEDNFNLPKYWLKGMRDCFILKVKGDSMINANINDGDFVVIQKHNAASHNEIVAVNIEGSATLKRLYLKNNKAMLMPENEKYEPIKITEEEGVYILGKAVGIIRPKQ